MPGIAGGHPHRGHSTVCKRDDRVGMRGQCAGMNNKWDILHEISSILTKHINPEKIDVFLFGSWAKGTEKRTSDIDLAIRSHTDLSRALIAKLREEFEESTIPYRIDIVDLRSASDEFVQNVMKEGIIWTDWNNG